MRPLTLLLLLAFAALADSFVPLAARRRAAAAALRAKKRPGEDAAEDAEGDANEWFAKEYGDQIPEQLNPPKELTMEEALAKDPAIEDIKKGNYFRGPALGMDDPLDAPWRLEAAAEIEELVKEKYPDAQAVDVLWAFSNVQITVTPKEDANVPLSSAVIEMLTRAISDDLFPAEPELAHDHWLTMHALSVCTPGASNVITTQEQFEAYKGFQVDVVTLGMPKSDGFAGVPGKVLTRTQTRT